MNAVSCSWFWSLDTFHNSRFDELMQDDLISLFQCDIRWWKNQGRRIQLFRVGAFEEKAKVAESQKQGSERLPYKPFRWRQNRCRDAVYQFLG